MAGDAILKTLAGLHVVDNDGVKLRHQPLVLLHAMHRVSAGGERLVPYAAIRTELQTLIGDLGGGAKQPDASIPVNVLLRPLVPNAVPVWEIEGHAELPRKSKRERDVSDATLVERGTRVGLSAEFANQIAKDASFADEATAVLLKTYFPTDDHDAVLTRVRSGLDATAKKPGAVRTPTVWRVYCREAEGGRDYAPFGVLGGYFALGGTRTGPVTGYASRDAFVSAFTKAYEGGGAERAKEVWRLHEEALEGDWVLMPARGDRTVHIGKIAEDGYTFVEESAPCRFGHRWAVEWLGVADYALVRKHCGHRVLTPGTLAVPGITPVTVASLLAAANPRVAGEGTAKLDHEGLERWADRARRTATLSRAGYDYAAMRGALSWETARALCRLTWITIGQGGDPDPLGTTVSARYWQKTKLPGLIALFALPPKTATLEAAAEQLVTRNDAAIPTQLLTATTGFTNFYNAFRGDVLDVWLRANEQAVLSLLARARHLDSRAAGHLLADAVAGLPDVPRGSIGKGGIAATQLLTPVLACLDPRSQFPILNGADHVRSMLARLGAADAALSAQHDALVDFLDPTDPWRRDAFALDAHGIGSLKPRRPTRARPITPKPTDGKDLKVRDASDILAIVQGGRRRVRRLHNDLTNALIRICTGTSKVQEGDSADCMFDALIRDYDGTGRDLLVEVKSTTDRGVLRLAVGQLLDYRRGLARRAQTDLAVLLPSKPDDDGAAFLRDVGVLTLWIENPASGPLGGEWRGS